MARALALVTVVAALLVPASAAAATRYAAPGGGMVPGCAQATPCSLEYAIGAATAGDEVVVGPGDYTAGATIKTETPLWIHGQPGAVKPRIFAADKVVLESFVTQRISDLAFESTNSIEGTLFLPADGTVLERLEIYARGADALGLRAGNNFTMTDSLVFAENSLEAFGVFIQATAPGSVELRNDTIVAEGSQAMALSVFMVAKDSSLTVAATNTIASGGLFDASARKSSEATGSSVAIRFDHSNLDRTDGEVTSVNGQTAPPQFTPVNPRGFMQAPTSPTIDAGVTDARNGPIDLIGSGRGLPGRESCTEETPAITDIGAYEFVPLEVVCVPQTRITKLKKLRRGGVRIRFRATGIKEMATFRCRLDKRRWRPCASPKTYKDLKPRRHVIKVRAFTPRASDQTPAKRKFRVKPPAPSKDAARR
ncbi:MAG TPA: hypothetical protein VFN92_06790 [Solirubrobacterales bacterium]|nr:hypothetical protein [Solirubrobacterales bacterium]